MVSVGNISHKNNLHFLDNYVTYFLYCYFNNPKTLTKEKKNGTWQLEKQKSAESGTWLWGYH